MDKLNLALLPKNKTKITIKLNIKMMGELLKEKQFTKYLCILIDNKFIWSQQINYIKLKISKGMSILTQLRRIISKETLTMLFLNLYNLTLTIVSWYGVVQQILI